MFVEYTRNVAHAYTVLVSVFVFGVPRSQMNRRVIQ